MSADPPTGAATRWGRGAVVVLGLLAAAQAYAARRDERRFPPPGTLVDVGGRRMHLDVRGPDDAPGPTVVLDAGLGSFSANWHWVQTELAATSRVVAYDRAGLGWSERGPRPRDARTLATELRTALRDAGVPGPFVLAGHSFGWLPVRAFADLYRDETVGLVAVDGSHPDQWVRWPTPHADRILRTANRATAVVARLGLPRVLDLAAPVSAGLPPRQRAELRARTARPLTSAVEADQLAGWAASLPFPSLGDLPLVVLGVSEQPFGGATLTTLSEELAEDTTNAVRRVVHGATHESLVARREHAAEVVAAIRAVITAAGAAPAGPRGTPRAARPARPR
jgi:pimeloyl-ACP methyl ester carboxylesterase